MTGQPVVDLTQARAFGFKDKPFYFRWIEGSRGIYVFTSKAAPYAVVGLPLHPEDDATYEAAQQVAREYIQKREPPDEQTSLFG